MTSDRSTKRLAWAFGCAKKDSEEERKLYLELLKRFREILKEQR